MYHSFKKEKIYASYRNKIIIKDGIYHLTQRAPGKEKLFMETGDYLTMLHLVKKYARDFKLDIISFCLMPNHIHLLVHINKPNLPEAMRSLFTAYAMRFNQKYKRKGHVFCGVYRAALCLDDLHLLTASLYIHLNPYKAKLAKKQYPYRWSSIDAYSNTALKSFIRRDFILNIIDDHTEKAVSLYKEIFCNSIAKYCARITKNHYAVIAFAKNVLREVNALMPERQINKKFIVSELYIDEEIQKIQGFNKKYVNTAQYKKIITCLINKLLSRGLNLTQISKKLKISRSKLYRYYQR